MKTIRFRLTFIDQLLATTPGNEEIYADFIASKATLDKTIASKANDPHDREEIKAYKKEIDLLFKVFPDANDKSSRVIKLENYGELGMCERPLRAQTMQGERVALSRSESAQPGTQIEFDVVMLRDTDEDVLMEWMDYGVFNGLGQWRNSGKGAFEYEVLAIDGTPVK